MLISIYLFDYLEADQVYSFVRQLPKKAEAYLNREYELECQVNHHKAPVNWYKGEEKIEADGQRFEISKDLTGICRLIFNGPIKEDNGEYSCKIEKQNLKTSCHLKFIGNFKIQIPGVVENIFRVCCFPFFCFCFFVFFFFNFREFRGESSILSFHS